MNFAGRQEKTQRQLEELRADCLLVSHMPNVRYLCGFTGSSGVLAIHAGKPVFFTDGRYSEQAHDEVQGARVVVARNGPLKAGVHWIKKSGHGGVGIEAQHTTLATRSSLKLALGKGFRLIESGEVVEKLRQVKDEAEIAIVREAVSLGASLLGVALRAIRPGARETEVAAKLEYAARQRGAEGMSFETIVAAGRRSALPHGKASAARIPARGFVVLDFGVILHGYCSDMTRTVRVGKVSRSDRDLYEAVREAQQAGVEAVRAGIPCGEVDQAARSVLRRARLDRYFTHSTGHGVGLEIHEGPRIARGEREILQPGMVITIEPGVYVPGRGGVRIEDMVVVRDGGCEVLTPAPKALIEL